MAGTLDFVRWGDLPRFSRRNFVYELPQNLLWGIVVGLIEGPIAGIVAAKTFHASAAATSVVWALPIIMNLLNPVWGAALRGRRRLPLLRCLVTGAALVVMSVGLTPQDAPYAAWLFALQIGLVHVQLSAIITLRTSMWRLNYPATHRARATGRLQTVLLLMAMLAGGGASLLFGWSAGTYRIVYPAAAAAGLLALWPLGHLRVRGERAELRETREVLALNGMAHHGWRRVAQALREAVLILREDRRFAFYMVAQFMLGSSNFFTEPLLLIIVTRELHFGYFQAAFMLELLPAAVLLLSIGMWAALFDRIGLLHFRVYNSATWIVAHTGVLAAMALLALGPAWYGAALAVLVAARIANGLARSSGTIAWNLGHFYFARPHQTELYMGVHVGLTGLRGLIMPAASLACAQFMGHAAFVVALALALVAHAMYRRMERE